MTVNGVVLNTDDETDAKNTADEGSQDVYHDPLTNRDLIKKSIEAEDIGPQTWGVTIEYALANRDDPNPQSSSDSPIFSFDTTGGTTHITNAITGPDGKPAQKAYPVPGSGFTEPPDTVGLIGVTRDNTEGVDVVVPTLKYSESHVFDSSIVTPSWIAALGALTGSTNLNPWRIWASNQGLFLGCAGQSQPDGLVKIDFHFEIGINTKTLTVAGVSNITKNAHDYLWTWNVPDTDTVSQVVIHKPKAVYVAQVYQPMDWTGLGI
jgi:hypothetical protein